MSNKKSTMKWSWVLFISFFLLSVINIRFAIAGILCMLFPLYHVFMGRGKVHCSKYCPRGSFLKNALSKMTIGLMPPKFMSTGLFKHSLLAVMLLFFGFSLFHARGDFSQTSMAVLRLMAVSSVFAILLGIIYKPRVWCTVCPMGHATKLIHSRLK